MVKYQLELHYESGLIIYRLVKGAQSIPREREELPSDNNNLLDMYIVTKVQNPVKYSGKGTTADCVAKAKIPIVIAVKKGLESKVPK